MEKFIELIDHSQFKQVYEEIKIDPKQRSDILAKFYNNFSKQWNANDKTTLRKLEKISKFSKEELEVIQPKFLALIEKQVFNKVYIQEGISTEQFLNFVKKYMEKSKISFVQKYEKDYFSKIFKGFDQDQNGFLDFRQFMCCISILLRGSLRDRLVILT